MDNKSGGNVKKPRFVRKDWHKISSLGLRRKNKQVWRKPKGRHNKLREKKKSHGVWPSIGYRSPRIIRGTVKGIKPVIVHNEMELENLSKDNGIIIAHVGLKNKSKIVKKAVAKSIRILNLNTKEFLKDLEAKSGEPNKKPSQVQEVKENKK